MIKKIIAAAALAFVAASSQAAEPGSFYGGADLGVTMHGSRDYTQTSYGAFLGYNINKNFAVEANYRRLYAQDIYGYGSKEDQAGLSLIASQPLTESLSVYGRVGVNRLTDTFTDGASKYTGHATHLLAGVGLGYKLTEKVSARVEVQRPDGHLTNLSTGISYSF
jgi:OOP family OmpA-OmpF porin